MPTNFDLAPPPVAVGGRTVVPVDIQTIDARLVFDGAGSAATGDATITFVVGPNPGCPMFDLRQMIATAWLDGASLPLASVLVRDLGGGADAEMKVLDVSLAAGTTHTLRVTYNLSLPASPGGGGYPPSLTFSSGPRVAWNGGFTDLAPGRYLESWLPANLIWDQYAIDVEILVSGTAVAHTLITNGASTHVAANHWRVSFPAASTATSTLFELRATDRLEHASAIAPLPSGANVTVDAWKASTNSGVSLASQLTAMQGWLAENETEMGPYAHGNRFVAFIQQGGMEYDGGCTSGVGALRHETYHSWWGRAVRPASQSDGWFDEGWNQYHGFGGTGSVPLNFADPPRVLCDRNPYARVTPAIAYGAGNALFNGLAALATPSALRSWMSELYRTHRDKPITTLDVEALLLARSGKAELVDAFHRFVYGLPDPSPSPDLWLRDDPGHTGADLWTGRFWDSPDLWIRHRDDGGTAHQSPVSGRDNFFYARLRNRGAGTARHFMVTFQVLPFAGVQFSWPGDFVPSIAATGGFDLGPGDERIASARWPAAEVPAVGTHACWLAAVLTRGDRPAAGRHVWEHGNLAQKNLSVIRARRGMVVTIPFVARLLKANERTSFEIRRSQQLDRLSAQIVARRPFALLRGHAVTGPFDDTTRGDLTDCGFHLGTDAYDSSSVPDEAFLDEAAATFKAGAIARSRLALASGANPLGLRIGVPNDAPVGTHGPIDLVQLDGRGRPVGGIAVQLEIE